MRTTTLLPLFLLAHCSFEDLSDLTGGARQVATLAEDAGARPPPDMSADAGTGASDGGGDGSEPERWTAHDAPAVPVTVVRAADGSSVAVKADGKFMVEFARASGWALSSWYDLATSMTQNLAAPPSRALVRPLAVDVAGSWYYVNAAGGTIAVVEESDVRARLRTDYELRPNATDVLQVRVDYTVYPSARVVVAVQATNAGASPLSISAIEYPTVAVSDAVPWSAASFLGDQAFAFARLDGPSPLATLIAYNRDGDKTLSSNSGPVNRYWSPGGRTFAPGEAWTRHVEIDLAPLGATADQLAARVADAFALNVSCLSSVSLEPGYDTAEGIVRLRAHSDDASFCLSPAANPPAVAIEGVRGPAWSLEVDGAVVASWERTRTNDVVASYDAAAQRLTFVYARPLVGAGHVFRARTDAR